MSNEEPGYSQLPVKGDIQRPLQPSGSPPFTRSFERSHQDYRLIGEIDSVEPISDGLVAHIQGNIEAYGATLVDLPDEIWETSCIMWNGGDSWEVLVELWTAEEGRSDLCLEVNVHDTDSGFRFEVHMVYTP
ncbi:hypothetical protein AB0J48_34135 [Nocardia salmonicida]|uniref:DUF7668 domain-containing protein n=1 Tax=Nocardia salmonicida TaxID=53431 RepID=UPI0034320F7F